MQQQSLALRRASGAAAATRAPSAVTQQPLRSSRTAWTTKTSPPSTTTTRRHHSSPSLRSTLSNSRRCVRSSLVASATEEGNNAETEGKKNTIQVEKTKDEVRISQRSKIFRRRRRCRSTLSFSSPLSAFRCRCERASPARIQSAFANPKSKITNSK